VTLNQAEQGQGWGNTHCMVDIVQSNISSWSSYAIICYYL
jgi:hypothetical protein